MHQRCVSDFCIESYIPFFLPSLSFPRHSVDKDLIRKDSSKILFGYNYACVFIKFGNLINACYVIYPFINHLVKYLKVHGVTDLDLRILARPREYTFLTFLNDSKIGRYPVQRQRFPVKKKNDSNFTSTTWVCIASSRSWNGQTELWLYDSVVASFQLYELTFERSFHVFLRWFRVVPEHCVHGHHHTRSTKATLDSVVLHHALLHGNISCIFFIKEAIFPIITFFYLNWNSD